MVENTEGAKKYLDEVNKHLKELRLLSLDAGMNTHASIWLSIEAAFMESMDEVQTVVDMHSMYIDSKLRAVNL